MEEPIREQAQVEELQAGRRKRVLFLAPQPFFANRGTPFNVRAILETLSAEGYQVDLFAYPFGEEIPCANLTISRSFSCGFRSVPIGPSLKKVILDVPFFFQALWQGLFARYDLFHGVEEAGLIAWILARLKRRPYIFDMDSCMTTQLAEHRHFSNPLFLKLVEFFEKKAISGADAVLTVCTALTEKARDFSSQVPIYQIEDFPLEQAERIEDAMLGSLREEFALSGKRLLVYTGNFEPYQGIDLLLEAFSKIASKFPEARVLLVGGGELASEKVRDYREKASKCGIAEQVIFTGLRPNTEMGAFMALAEILVSPRVIGGNTPLKLYSYMAAERAIVATTIKAHSSVLDDSCSYLSDVSADAYARALEQALNASGERDRKIAKAKELVETRYSRDSFKKRLRKLYLDVLGPAV